MIPPGAADWPVSRGVSLLYYPRVIRAVTTSTTDSLRVLVVHCWVSAMPTTAVRSLRVAAIGLDSWWEINGDAGARTRAYPRLGGLALWVTSSNRWPLRLAVDVLGAIQVVDRRVDAALTEWLRQRSCVGE